MRQEHPDEPLDVIEHMKRGIELYAGGKGEGYDYKTAIEKGVSPSISDDDNKYHWFGDIG